MKKILKTASVFLLLFLIIIFADGSKAYSQDDSDLFEDLDEEVQEIKSSDKKSGGKKSSGFIGKIADNFEGSLKLRYYYFPEEADDREGLDDNQHFGEIFFEFSTWTGNDTVQLHTTAFAQAGTQEDAYRGATKWFQDNEYYRRYFDCNELYFLLLTDNFDVTLGKKKFSTGISTLFSPSDRFKPGDIHDPMDPKQFGIWMGKLDFSFHKGQFTFMVIPIHTEKKIPPPNSRWWGERNTDLNPGSYTGINGNAEARRTEIEWRNVDVFVKYKKTLKGWDYFVSGNTGPNPYDVIKKEDTTYIKVKNRIYSLASGFSTTFGSFEFHGEALYNYSEGRKDDDYVSSVAGFTYTMDDNAKYLMMEKIFFVIEYAGEIKIHNQSASQYTESSDEGRAGQNDLFAKIDMKYSENLKFYYYANFDFDTKSWMNHFEAEYKIREGLVWSIAYQLFDYDDSDDEDSESSNFDSVSYRDWDKNDRIITYLKYSF